MTTRNVTITFQVSEIEAECLAQFLKRLDFNDCRRRATTDDEAYIAQDAAAQVRTALAEAG